MPNQELVTNASSNTIADVDVLNMLEVNGRETFFHASYRDALIKLSKQGKVVLTGWRNGLVGAKKIF